MRGFCMRCQKCGTDNADDSIFCSNCGNRLVNKTICKQCGKTNSADNKFCVYCGANLTSTDNKTKNVESSVFPGFDFPKSKTGALQIGLSLSSFITCCLTVLFSLIFTFFIGAKVTSNSASGGAEINIFYFFSTVFEEFPETSTVAIYGQSGAAIGTISAVLIMLGIIITILLFTDSIIKFFNHKIKSLTKYAVLSYLIYIAGISLFMFNSHTSLTISIDYQNIVSAFTLNGATIAGIVLGGITFLATIVLDTINKCAISTSKSSISMSITTLISFIFGIVVLSLLGCGILTFSEEGVTMGTGILAFFEIVFSTANAIDQSSPAWQEFAMNFAGSMTIIVFMFICVLLFILMFILMMKEQLTDFGYNYKNKHFVFGCFAGISIILVGIFQIVLASVYGEYFFATTSYVLVIPSFLIVLGVLQFINSLVGKIMCSKKPKEIDYYNI